MFKNGYLSQYFEGVAIKSLSMVDATPTVSNQHEVGTTKIMRDSFLGSERKKFDVNYIWIGDENQSIAHEAFATHYDTRQNQRKRSPEWRLYYPGNEVTELMNAGDTLFLAKRANQDQLIFIVVQSDSTIEKQLIWLFGLQRPKDKFASRGYSTNDEEVGFAAQLILDEIAIEPQIQEVDRLDDIVSRFEGTFPKTKEFSSLARKTAPETNVLDDPDHAVTTWLSHEEAMFRRLELKIVSRRLEEGFSKNAKPDVDGFLQFSLSVQNRRKSRMGHSFEHHLAALFDAYELEYERGAVTEQNQKPDFLFPNLDFYKSSKADDPRLKMLAVKSTCKDRWRQILAEAEKISTKHLVTLEPSISEKQTKQMASFNVQLVVPKSITDTYLPEQRDWLWSLRDFISEIQRN